MNVDWVYAFITISSILIIVYLKYKYNDIYKLYKKIKNTEEKVLYEEFLEDKNTAAGVGFLMMKEYFNKDLMDEITNSIKATILELHLAKIISLYKNKDGIYSIKFLKHPNKIERSQLVIYQLLKTVYEIYGEEGQVKLHELSVFMMENKEETKQYIKQFNRFVLQEQKDNGYYDRDKKEIYIRWREYFFASIILTLFTCGFFIMQLAIINILNNSISIVTVINASFAIILTTLMSYNVAKVAKQLYKTSLGLTIEGVKEQEKWRRLKKYIEKYTLLRDSNDLEMIQIKEKYLVYAVLFGISDKVAKQFDFNEWELKEVFNKDEIYSYSDIS